MKTTAFVEEVKVGTRLNHNETLVQDTEQIELEVEELEDVIAPGKKLNHSETLVRDSELLSARNS